jgi:hypothetical protein
MRHIAIVVTSWNSAAIEEAAAKARACGLDVLGPSTAITNGIRTLLVCPDGYPLGWDERASFDARRDTFMDYLNGVRYEDGSSCLSWVAMAYGSHDENAEITAHTWQRLEAQPSAPCQAADTNAKPTAWGDLTVNTGGFLTKDETLSNGLTPLFDLTTVVNVFDAGKLAERNRCRYPDCIDNEDERCPRWLTGECHGPKPSRATGKQ